MSLEKKVDEEKVKIMADRAISYLRSIPDRREECKEEGHKDVHWMPHFISNRGNNYQRKGLCNYCHTWVTRGLTVEEARHVERFYRDLQRPIYR